MPPRSPAPRPFPAGPNGGDRSNPVAIVTGDFNRDGKLDVATANFRAGGVSVLLGTGTGGFKPTANLTLPLPPVNIITADLNGDGKLDLVTANHGIFQWTVPSASCWETGPAGSPSQGPSRSARPRTTWPPPT